MSDWILCSCELANVAVPAVGAAAAVAGTVGVDVLVMCS